MTPTEFLVILTTSGFSQWCTKGWSNLYYHSCASLCQFCQFFKPEDAEIVPEALSCVFLSETGTT